MAACYHTRGRGQLTPLIFPWDMDARGPQLSKPLLPSWVPSTRRYVSLLLSRADGRRGPPCGVRARSRAARGRPSEQRMRRRRRLLLPLLSMAGAAAAVLVAAAWLSGVEAAALPGRRRKLALPATFVRNTHVKSTVVGGAMRAKPRECKNSACIPQRRLRVWWRLIPTEDEDRNEARTVLVC